MRMRLLEGFLAFCIFAAVLPPRIAVIHEAAGDLAKVPALVGESAAPLRTRDAGGRILLHRARQAAAATTEVVQP